MKIILKHFIKASLTPFKVTGNCAKMEAFEDNFTGNPNPEIMEILIRTSV